jgi:micrococcal nuclease
MYDYKATIVRVIDGDTVLMDVDLGFYTYSRMSCRLAGLNAIELNQPGGSQARTHLTTLLPQGTAVVVQSVKPDKYAGRFDAIVTSGTGGGSVNINDTMVADGYAAPWDGSGPRPVPVWPIVGSVAG